MRKYIKVQHLGDKLISDLLEGQVTVEEKIDGSQFRIQVSSDGIKCGSKGVDFDSGQLDKNFKVGVENAERLLKGIDIPEGRTLHIFAEYLQSPHHNTLSYGRIPTNNIMVFDVIHENPDGSLVFYDHKMKLDFAEAVGFEPIPTLYHGDGKELTEDKIQEMLKSTSALGKEPIEGIVVKNYSKFYDPIKFPYYAGMFKAGKFVRAEFTERNKTDWNAKKGSMEQFLETLPNQARWVKAVQHLKDEGKLADNMTDMKELIPELLKDFGEEEIEFVKEQLWNIHKKQIMGAVQRGFAEWYKNRLLSKQLEITA